MKRALMVSTGTLVGLYGTLSYAPIQAAADLNLGLGMASGSPSLAATDGTSSSASGSASGSASASASDSATASSGSATPKPAATSAKPTPKPSKTKSKPSSSATPSPSDSSTPTPTGPQDGDFLGTSERAGKYGVVQVQIRVSGGVIVDLGVVAYPTTEKESIDISGRSIPLLRDAVLSSQSSQVASISGATFTSSAFIKSLAAAMLAAGL